MTVERARTLAADWLAGLAHAVWPRGPAGSGDQGRGPLCELCGREAAAPAFHPARVCLACAARALAFRGHACRRCGRPVPAAAPGPVCDECTSAVALRGAAGFSRTVALGIYEGALAEWVKDLKYRGRRSLARPLGLLLAWVVRGSLGPAGPAPQTPMAGRALVRTRSGWGEAVVVPVPLHAARERERGYNQAALIAEALAEALGARLDDGALMRREGGPAQAGLGRAARLRNLAGAFVLRPGAGGGTGSRRWQDAVRGRGRRQSSADRVAGRDVLLVDDVITTGATLDQCAKPLLDAGARRVLGCVVAAGVPRRLWS